MTKVVLLAFGGSVSLAGLWLIFRPPRSGEKTIIHLLGLKFEAASAGILVFVLGIGVIWLSVAAPLQSAVAGGGEAPTSGSGPQSTTTVEDGGGATTTEGDENGSKGGGTGAVLQPADPTDITFDGKEIEPNNSTGSANLMKVGASVVGEISPEDAVDVFRIDTSEYLGSTLYVTLTGDGSAGLLVQEPNGKSIFHELMGYGGSMTFQGPVKFRSYIARVGEGHGGPRSSYELLVTTQ